MSRFQLGPSRLTKIWEIKPIIIISFLIRFPVVRDCEHFSCFSNPYPYYYLDAISKLELTTLIKLIIIGWLHNSEWIFLCRAIRHSDRIYINYNGIWCHNCPRQLQTTSTIRTWEWKVLNHWRLFTYFHVTLVRPLYSIQNTQLIPTPDRNRHYKNVLQWFGFLGFWALYGLWIITGSELLIEHHPTTGRAQQNNEPKATVIIHTYNGDPEPCRVGCREWWWLMRKFSWTLAFPREREREERASSSENERGPTITTWNNNNGRREEKGHSLKVIFLLIPCL